MDGARKGRAVNPVKASGALALVALAAVAQAAEPTGTAVEYYNTFLRHYFLTASPADMALIDAGSEGPGWQRTGGQFGVFRSPGEAPGLSPVCRFYGTPGIGPNSHFFTADPGECAVVKRDPGWTFEGIAF